MSSYSAQSALPQGVFTPQKTSTYLHELAKNPDRAIMSDDDVFAMKGGMPFFLTKFAMGLGATFGFLVLSGRLHEVKNFNIKGRFFLILS